MDDLEALAPKLAALGDRIERVRQHRPATANALIADRDRFDLVSYDLMLAIHACTDIATHLIADEGWPPARDLAEAFRRLHEREVISRETSDALARATGARLPDRLHRPRRPGALPPPSDPLGTRASDFLSGS